MELTIQQAIFEISNLTKRKQKLLTKMQNIYNVPLKVNGKDVFDKEKARFMLDDIAEINSINSRILTIKNALTKVNINTKINGKNLLEIIEEVKIKRELLQTLENSSSLNRTEVETGVGVVDYGVLNSEKVESLIKKLEEEINNLSSLIDKTNSETLIKINIK